MIELLSMYSNASFKFDNKTTGVTHKIRKVEDDDKISNCTPQN